MAEEKQNPELQEDPLTEVLESFKKQQKLVGGAVLVVFLVFGGITLNNSMKESAELEAQAHLFKIEKNLNDLEAKKPAEDGKETAKEQDFTQVKTQLKSFIAENKSQKAAIRASLMLAKIFAGEKDAEGALASLNLVNPSLSDGVLSVLYFTQKLSFFIDTEKYDDAIKVADKILAKEDMGFTHPVAYLKKAIAVEKKGNIEEAKALYKRLSSEFPDHAAGKTAKHYLRIL